MPDSSTFEEIIMFIPTVYKNFELLTSGDNSPPDELRRFKINEASFSLSVSIDDDALAKLLKIRLHFFLINDD